MVGNGNETENIVQDCFLRFWENRDKIQQINNLSAYLFFMARNLAIDHLRHRKITNKPLYPTIALETDETEQQVSFRELDERLWQAIAQLPERCRIAFEYSRINGLSHQQIAEKMQITVKGVEALIGRSIKILREELADFLVVASFFLTTF
jgi:RNA polymerase sigma-70 factor (ECF subfamily)